MTAPQVGNTRGTTELFAGQQYALRALSSIPERRRTPPFIDGQIAAVAIVNRLTLVTRNTNDFADFAGLTVENWFEA